MTTAKRTCQDYGPKISAYIDGELSREEQIDLERHLEKCENCRRLQKELLQTSSLIKTALSDETVPQVDFEAIWKAIESKGCCRPSLWQRLKAVIKRPVVFLPAAAASAAAAALLLFLHPAPPPHPTSLATSQVESFSCQEGQVMVFQNEETGQPIIWIFPAPEKEARS